MRQRKPRQVLAFRLQEMTEGDRDNVDVEEVLSDLSF